MAFVAQYMPNLGTNGGVIPPLAPLAPDALASAGGFERFEGFTTDEGTAPDSCKEQKQISCQVGQFAIASLIELPTSLNFLLVERSFGIALGQVIARGFQFVNLATGACLVSIHAAGVHKERARELHRRLLLARIGAEHDRRDQAMHPPVKTEHAVHGFPLGKRRFRHLDDHIEDPHPPAICFAQLPQVVSHRHASLEALSYTGGQGEGNSLFSAPPPATLHRETEAGCSL